MINKYYILKIDYTPSVLDGRRVQASYMYIMVTFCLEISPIVLLLVVRVVWNLYRRRLEEEQRQRQLADEARQREAQMKKQAELLEQQRKREEDVQRYREMELRQREGLSVCAYVLLYV